MKKKIISFILVLTLFSCVEPYNVLESVNYEKTLVVESTLTDELAFQKVKLTMASNLNINTAISVYNAQVWVEASDGSNYSFSESENGTYLSDSPFKALLNVDYQLKVKTTDGNEYESTKQQLTSTRPITNIYAELATVNGVEGVQVYVDSDYIDASENASKYFRYEFEETHKIYLPVEITHKIKLTDITFPLSYTMELVPLEEEQQTCYTTEIQKNINILNISNQGEQLINKHPVRFLKARNKKIAVRYSILVKQYSQNYETYGFYKTLKKLSTTNNVFEESQAGFVAGNVKAINNIEEKVIGIFNVSSVSEKRLFFNVHDFNLPPNNSVICEKEILNYEKASDRRKLYWYFNNPNPAWSYMTLGSSANPPFYEIVSRSCGDCTYFSSNIRPEFWVD